LSEIVLKLNGLTKTYKRVHLGQKTLSRGISELNLEVGRGEVFGLLGLNGSGKTTAIKLILGLLFPTEGSAEVLGRPVSHPDALKRIGFLPEIPSFFRNLTSVEVLSLYGTVSGIPSAVLTPRIEAVLDQVKLTSHKTKPVRELSKGMLQRLGLAQAILHEPELLILDEPVTGLDPLGIRQTRELLANLAGQGTTIFFSSHSISELERLATRVGILVEGKLARLIPRAEWEGVTGKLEELFLETLKISGVEI
jgi:ABC-2 type transport system ATP-binding protein